ncbi:MAG: hypothetical protein KJO88_03355 [Gammaproteobacteria bacterium]|nr:hypothetical protein [Gammaproteobacteria bacterium]NNM12731.1 hypothetical protein [Gammaproteobacteria bacterium]
MNLKSKIFIGGLFVFGFTVLSVLSDYASFYSPFSNTVVLPVVLSFDLGLSKISTFMVAAIPMTIFYLCWSVKFINKSYIIAKPTFILVVIASISSVIYNLYFYKVGFQFHGHLQTLLLCYNLVAITLLGILYKLNEKRPNIKNCLGFNVLFFCWLGWSAYPAVMG